MTNETNSSGTMGADADPHFNAWVLVGHWRLLVKCAVTSLVLGTVYLLLAPKTFEAEARVLVQKEGLSLDRGDAVRAEKHFLETQAEVIRSPLTVSRALEAVVPETPIVKAIESLRVTPVVDTNVLKISYRSPRATEPARMIEAIIESYQQHLKEVERDTYSDTLVLLTQQEADVRRELEELESRYEELHRSSSLVGQGGDAFHVQTMQLRHLSEQLAKTKGDRVELENKLLGFALAVNTPRQGALHPISTAPPLSGWGVAHRLKEQDVAMSFYAAIADNSVYGSAAQQLLREEASSKIGAIDEAEQELALARAKSHELGRKFGYKHHDLLAVQQQVAGWEDLLAERKAAWKTFLGERAQSLSTAIRQRISNAKFTEQTLNQMVTVERGKAKELDNDLLKEKLMLGNIERVEKLHELTLTKLSDFQLADQALAGGRASVTVRLMEDPAETEAMIWPRPFIFLLLCLVLGLGGGTALVYLGPWLESRPECNEGRAPRGQGRELRVKDPGLIDEASLET